MTAHVVRRHRDVTAVLADASFAVPEAELADTGIRWLRGAVSRWTNGAGHALRRAHVESALTGVDAARLRHESAARTIAVLDRADGALDVMGALARHVPIAVLGDALELGVDPPALVALVTPAAAAYPPDAAPEAEALADDAVERLVELLGGRADATVAQLTLLMQACDATAGLIGNALGIGLHLSPRSNVAGILAETLRFLPPVRGTHRAATAERSVGDISIRPGDTVQLDFDAANRDPDVFHDPDRFDPERLDARYLTFGSGFRACPGMDPALGLAAGVVAVVLDRCEPAFAAGDVEYEASPLRMPKTLDVRT